MSDMVRDLLAYSRVGGEQRVLESIDCNAVLADVIADLPHPLDENGATVSCAGLPEVRGDRSQLGRLFQNLLTNALKFRSEEPPHVEISAALVTDLSVQKSGEVGEWLFRVRDNGIGLDPKDADRIFGVFQRLHTHEEYPGTGIGLAICKRIVDRHGGRIGVESSPGEGATFCFALPAAEAYSANEAPAGVC